MSDATPPTPFWITSRYVTLQKEGRPEDENGTGLDSPDEIMAVALYAIDSNDAALWQYVVDRAAHQIMATPRHQKSQWREPLGIPSDGGHANPERAESELSFGQCWVQLQGSALGSRDPGRTWGIFDIDAYNMEADRYLEVAGEGQAER